MPQVVFASRDGEPLSVDAPDGGSLADLCDDADAPVAVSCLGATCGTCRVEILEGAELLLPPESDEHELLAVFARPSAPEVTHRMACQAMMRASLGRIVLRATNPLEPRWTEATGVHGSRRRE